MEELSLPLDEDELDELDAFLLERIDDDAGTEGRDEGVLDIAELDGLLTAVVSGPVVVPPSRWLPAVWGDFEPAFEGEEEFEEVLELMTRHLNSIALLLYEEPEQFEPLFNEHRIDGITYTVVDEWCEGYLRGVALAQTEWDAGGEDVASLLEPIAAFTGSTSWRGHEADVEESDRLRRAIASSVRALYEFWAARRESRKPPIPIRRLEPRVGRNDPCPCGSGKKYKKCCLH